MKRPLALYVVAVWCFFGLFLQVSVLSRKLEALFGKRQAVDLYNVLPLIAFILVVWHVARLVQLRAFNRWASIVFFGLWTLSLTWNTVAFASSHRFEKPQRAIPALLTFAVFNVLCAWYLSRRSFRDFAVQFVAERDKEKHSRMMQKVAQKKIEKGIYS